MVAVVVEVVVGEEEVVVGEVVVGEEEVGEEEVVAMLALLQKKFCESLRSIWVTWNRDNNSN